MKCNWITGFSVFGLLVWVGIVSAQGLISMNNFVSQKISSQVARTVSSNISKALSDRMLMPQLKIRNESGKVKDFSISSDDRFFTVLHEDNTVRVWDAGQGIQRPMISHAGPNISKVASVSALNITLLGTDEGTIEVYDVYTGKKVNQLKGGDDVVSLSVSKDESLLLAAYENGEVIVWDLKRLKIKKRIKTPYDDDLKLMKIEANGVDFIVAGDDGFVDRWNIAKSEKIDSLAKHADDVVALWVSDVYGEVAFFDEDNVFQLTDNNTKVVKQEIDKDLLTITLSNDLKKIAIATEDDGIKVFDANTMQMLKQIKINKEITNLQFINQSKLLIAADEKGVLHLFSIASGEEIMKLISTETGWTIVDNKGRFDSSEKGMANISWEAEGFEIPLDNFSGSYYEPGLLASHLSDQVFINKQPQVVKQGIKLPPKSVIVFPEGDRVANKAIIVKVEAQGLGGGVEEIRFYHNGKIVFADAILDNRQETVDKLIKRTIAFKLFPIAGQNTFKVIATNKMGIEGHSDEVAFDFKGEKQKSILHVLTIGINQYKDSRLNLDYSVADANGIENVFKNSKFTAYNEVVQHELRDKQATKDEILKQLNIISQASQEDVVVVYLAGHGLAIDGEWYFMPHETLLNDNQSYYEQVGVSAKEIQEIFINSKVQHFMVMIDACYSGAGINAFRKMQDVQRHFSRDLSKSVGVVVLAATRKDQEAAELIDLGHGLFTYVVSEGMEGAADLNPKNSRISAHEVADYSTDTIPAFSKKYLGASQEPTSFTMGSDFTLLRQE